MRHYSCANLLFCAGMWAQLIKHASKYAHLFERTHEPCVPTYNQMVRRISPIDNQRLIYCFSISPILRDKMGEISVQDG